MSDLEKINIRKLSDDGYIWFTIRAEDTEYNTAIHSAFKDFCKVETRNDYTLGLKQMIEGYNISRQIGVLWDAIERLEKEVQELKSSGVVESDDEEVNEGVF